MVARRRKKNPRAKDLKLLRQLKRRRCRCPVVREFEQCVETAGVEWNGSTIGDWTSNWTKAVASVIERQKDEAELISGTGLADDTPTDFTWYEWEESAEVVSGKVPLALPAVREDGEAKKYPSMPCVTSELIQHRQKAEKVVRFFDALVSRPAGRKEMLTNPDALASMKKEWSGLIDQGVFDLGAVREYDSVAKEAKAKGEETNMARAHGICVEKHSQLPVGDPKRKFKGRGVLLGNQVKNQSFEAAMFQDLGNSPASFEASRWADLLGCHDGWDVQMADAVQAYIQATLRGTPCWIELPPEAVPSECNWGKYRRPVVPLRKALYGHPDAGTFWEQHCDESVRAVGFEPIGEEWPSVYIHERLQLVLVVYVDDFKMAGPKKNLAQGWSMLRTRLKIEPETGLDMYLGCNQTKGNVTLGNGHRVTTVTYDMEQFLRSCVDRYLVKLNRVVTPEIHEETKNHVSRKPAKEGPSVVCNWCNNLVPTDGPATMPDQRGGTPELAMKEPVRGHLAPHAASVLMKLLYGARIACFDLLRQVNRLARNVHKWTDSDDRGLHHLMCYVHHTKHWRMVGWVGDPMDDVHLALYADADFAGCVESLRSTSGGHLNIQGPNTRFPLSGSSKRQGCVSHSTPEAEIVAADVAMRAMGTRALKLLQRILKKSPNFVFYDDNKAMIGVVRSGRNPTMRHLERSHGVCISWMHEMFTRDYMHLAYEVTDRMAADIYTKATRVCCLTRIPSRRSHLRVIP